MSIHMQVVTVTATTYPTEPQVNAGFTGTVATKRVSGTPNVYVSLDGTTDHGLLVQTEIPAIEYERNTYQRVWLRLATVGTADVQVILES